MTKYYFSRTFFDFFDKNSFKNTLFRPSVKNSSSNPFPQMQQLLYFLKKCLKILAKRVKNLAFLATFP
jgi:hypothetical protein